MVSKISPISGFPEYLPAQQLAFNSLVAKVRAVYESFGYVPLETPAVERIDTLVSKGIDSKEVYALRRLNTQGEGDDGAKDLALKFDLTVPLARYVSQHYPDLVFPFRRYQVQPVFRGERAKAGRYRQFYQFDLDYITDGPLPLAADAEIIAAAFKALKSLGLKFQMMINNRKLLQGLLEKFGFLTVEDQKEATKIIDDLYKVGVPLTVTRLSEINDQNNAEQLVNIIHSTQTGAAINALNLSYTGKEGSDEISQLKGYLEILLGKDIAKDSSIGINMGIVRGLDYYTGTVIETFLIDENGKSIDELGSICSGGRYDNLAESLSDRKLPGVGISIGLSRLFSWMETQPQFAHLFASATTAQIFIPLPAESDLPSATDLAAQLRTQGLAVEQSLHVQAVPTQYQKAEKRGLKYAAIPEPDGKVTLRTFATRTNETGLTPAQIAAKIIK